MRGQVELVSKYICLPNPTVTGPTTSLGRMSVRATIVMEYTPPTASSIVVSSVSRSFTSRKTFSSPSGFIACSRSGTQ